MGRYTVRFSCHACLRCCTEAVVFPTPWDVIRIVRDEGCNPYEILEFITPDDIKGVDKDDPTWLKCGGKKYMMSLTRDEETGCHFLDQEERRCTIYESRPILCRLYPFKVELGKEDEFKGFSLHRNIECPKNKDDVVLTKPLYEIFQVDQEHHQDYDDLVEVFNRKDYPGKKPEDFINMFIEVQR